MRVGRVFVPTTTALVVAALVGLPLYQDGSSYLFELLVTHSAIRHHRWSAVLIQAPAIGAQRLLAALHVAPGRALPLVRLAFDLGYATVPLVALGLSWLVVRRCQREELLLWPALVILLVNLVNCSWVSELLIAVELCCPLLLTALLMPRTRMHRLMTAALLPFVWLLHPLVAPLLVTMGVVVAYARRAARATAAILMLAGLAKAVAGAASMTRYEAGFLAPDDLRTYLFVTSWENAAVLLVAVAIGAACYRAKTRSASAVGRTYVACAVVAGGAGALLVLQYCLRTRGFALKTGLTVPASMALMVLAALDAAARASARETRERGRLVTALALVFATVVLVKSALWHTAVTTLTRTLAAAPAGCVEADSADLGWLRRRPYTIIDNWALPSLALVVQDHPPRKLLLQPGDCGRYLGSGMVRIDPWTVLPARAIVPPLE